MEGVDGGSVYEMEAAAVEGRVREGGEVRKDRGGERASRHRGRRTTRRRRNGVRASEEAAGGAW